ncbi:MAG: MFS transporter [Nocardioidaceae bacterium]
MATDDFAGRRFGTTRPGQAMPQAATAAGSIAARIDRLPVGWTQWRLVLLGQLFWGAVVAMDPLVLRIYPVVWKPDAAFGPAQYALLVGFSNGLGPLLGDYIFGFFSDRFGRRTTMITACLIGGLLYIPVAFTSNWVVLIVAVTFASLGVGAAVATAPVYNTEISPPHARGRLLLGGQVTAWGVVGVLAVIPALFLLPQHLTAFVLVFVVFLVVVMIPVILLFVPESPRWLESKGRYAEADRIVSRMERAALRKRGSLPEPNVARYQVPVMKKVPVREVLRGVYLRRTIPLLIVWILAYAGVDYGFQAYWGVYIVERGFSAHDLFVMQLVGGIAGVAAVVIGAAFGERFERKTLVFWCGMLMCLSAACFFSFPDSYAGLMAASVFGGAGLSGFLGNMYNYTATAYPTRLRALGVGMTDGLGHIGAVVGPSIAGALYLATAGDYHYGWLLWFAVGGSLLPGLLIAAVGINQRGAVLEEISQ